jgi:hypothetical protein
MHMVRHLMPKRSPVLDGESAWRPSEAAAVGCRPDMKSGREMYFISSVK